MTKQWWHAAGVRALKTFAQTIIGAGVVVGAVSASTDWASVGMTIATIVLTALVAAVMSLFTSLAGLPEVNKE